MDSGVLIDVAHQFSDYPIGRDDGDSTDSNGKKFRTKFLVPALNEARIGGGQVVVSFEGVESFGSSFLEEAFGGLVREDGWSESELKKLLRISYDWQGYARAERLVWKYIREAKPEK